MSRRRIRVAVEAIRVKGEFVTTLRELLRDGLRVVFVGLNPAKRSVDLGHYYQGRHGIRFWNRLRRFGIVPDSLPAGAEDDAAFEKGFGFADLVRRPTKSGKDLSREEKRIAVDDLIDRLAKIRGHPTIIFTYKEPWGLAGPRLEELGYRVLRMPGPYTKRELIEATIRDIQRAIETAAEFFKLRAAGSDGNLKQYLDMVPRVAPDPGDELPEGWTPQ
jgi:double-stranded uracil-DNA glycosylase